MVLSYSSLRHMPLALIEEQQQQVSLYRIRQNHILQTNLRHPEGETLEHTHARTHTHTRTQL